jgi:hypothetical protein
LQYGISVISIGLDGLFSVTLKPETLRFLGLGGNKANFVVI